MFRLIVILIVAGLAALAAVWLADHDGTLTLTITGYEIRMAATTGAVLLLLLVAAVYVGIRLILRGPARLSRYFAARRARNAFHELSKGLIAAAAEDAHEAEHAEHHVERLLGAQPLVLLLKAEAARLTGDAAREEGVYRSMLENPETEFLSARRLSALALGRGELNEALALAIRAHRLKPKSAVAAESLFDVRVRRGEWAEARALLDEAVKYIGPESARRRAAMLPGAVLAEPVS